MATVDVKDAAGATVAIEKPLAPGRAAAASSKPVALSTEDKAALDAMSAKLPAALVSGRLPVQSVPQQGSLTDRSGTIATGGTAQQLMASNASRLGWWVQNVSTADLWINGTGTASAAYGSIRLVPGALYETPAGAVGSAAVSIFGATTGQAFTAREF